MSKVVVVGAGPVGATFALLAARPGVDVALLEAREGPSRESRTLALSHGSRETLSEAGVWSDSLEATPIHRIHTSQKGSFGRAEISRDDADVPALGYVMTYAKLQAALDDAMEHAGIHVERGAVVEAFDAGDTRALATVRYQHAGVSRAREADAVVLADGGANLAKVPAIRIEEKEYEQVALLGHIETDQEHRNVAYERFTPEGPAALLPLGGPRTYSLVWVSTPARIAELQTLPDDAFCRAFQDHFGFRAGRFLSVSARRSFPLRLRTVSTPVAGQIAVIGNAAQALHPVAGQGFNLGLRDAAMLARMIASEGAGALSRYAAARVQDVERSVGFTDFLVSAFSSDAALARVPRGLGLAMLDILPPARRGLARRMLFGSNRGATS
jgi:2-octaprenyl-6-methoxyphenol hydroxylase